MARLSERAQEILASVERDAAERRGALAAVPDLPPEPVAAPPAGRPGTPGDPARLLALVEQVAIGADEVQRRVEALHDALDAVADRLGLDLGDQPAGSSPMIAAALAAAAAAPPGVAAGGDADVEHAAAAEAAAAAHEAAVAAQHRADAPFTLAGPSPDAPVLQPPAPLPAALQGVVSHAQPGGLIAPGDTPTAHVVPPAPPTTTTIEVPAPPPADVLPPPVAEAPGAYVPPPLASELPPQYAEAEHQQPAYAPPPAQQHAPAPPTTAAPAAVDGVSETARLVAVEMAVAGYPRAQVGERLQRQYGVADPARILDEVFGRGTGADSRMPWT